MINIGPYKQDPKKWAKEFLKDYKKTGKPMRFQPIIWAFEDIVGKPTSNRSTKEEEWINTAYWEIRKLANV